MLEVVDRQTFEQLERRVLDMGERLSFVEELISNTQYVGRRKAMSILDVSESTLSRLTKDGKLTFRYEGRKVQYELESLRKHLVGKKVEGWAAKKRILAACYEDK